MITPEIHVSPELMAEFQKIGVSKEFAAGDIVLDEEAYIRSIPLVTKGIIKVLRTEEDGREILLYYIKSGESCVMSLSGGLQNSLSKVRVEVEEDATILFLPAEKIPDLIKNHPEWLDYIFKLYHKRFEELLNMVNEISFKKIDERLLSLLKKKQLLINEKIIPTTHEQLANELGTSRVVVSRVLKTMEEEGKLVLGRNKIEIL